MRHHQNLYGLVLFFLFSALALLLTGCGGSSESQSVATATDIPAPTQAVAETEATAAPAPTIAVEPTANQAAATTDEAAGELDMRELPRFADAEVIYEDIAGLIYVTPAEVATVADFSRQELGALGWQEYTPPFSAQLDDPNLKPLTFKKDGQGLSVFITVAPAQGNQTSVQYSPIPLEADLPALADATDIEFSDKQLYLGYTTSSDFDTVIAFYREQLTPPEWQEPPDSAVVGPEQAVLFFAGSEMALSLTLAQAGDDRTQVTLQGATVEELTALAATPTPVEAATEELEIAVSPAPSTPDVPIPADAQDVVYEAEEIVYSSPSDIDTLVKFYRQELSAQGWQEDEIISLVNANIASLEFAKEEAFLSFTMFNDGVGGATEVIIAVTGLAMETAETAGDNSEPTDDTDTEAEALIAEDKDGLPVPDNYTNYLSESTQFRREIQATSPSDLSAILEFYRQELPALGWQEKTDAASIEASEASLVFEGPDGLLDVKLSANTDGDTDILLATKNAAAAQEAGIVPPPGQARIYLGNFVDSQVIFTINQQEIKVEVQDPTQDSLDGVPFVDLPPGQQAYTFTIPGEAPINDQLEVGPDEVWGLMAGPGEALPLRLY